MIRSRIPRPAHLLDVYPEAIGEAAMSGLAYGQCGTDEGGYAFESILHEIGHAVGEARPGG